MGVDWVEDGLVGVAVTVIVEVGRWEELEEWSRLWAVEAPA